MPFGVIVNGLVDFLGVSWLYFLTAFMVVNALTAIYAKFITKKKNRLTAYFEKDTLVHITVYILAAVYASLYTLQIGPEAIIGDHTSGVVVGSVVLPTSFIILIGGLFVPLLLDFGGIDFLGTLMQPLMRPLFRLPGKAAVNATASFVSSSSIGVYITSKLYKEGDYTDREAVTVATGFSAVSVGFASIAANTLGLLPVFPKIFFSSFVITFIVSFFMVRLPPITWKKTRYFDGTEQTEKDIKEDSKYNLALLKKAHLISANKALASGSVLKKCYAGLIDGIMIFPKVVPFLVGVGVTSLIIAEYTPLFSMLGRPLIPIFNLLQIPDAEIVSTAAFVGIAEMLLPVLVVAGYEIAEAARFFIVTLALVQIIFFSETATVMLAMGIPVTIKELVILFVQRTLIAIPIVAMFMHMFY